MCSWLQSTESQVEEPAGGGLVAALAVPVTGLAAPVAFEAPPQPADEPGGRGWLASYLGCLVYGGLDGIITTFAIVSGVNGASLSPEIALILGAANLIGDGFSMATGAYLSAKSQNELYERMHSSLTREYAEDPLGPEHRLRQAYIEQGYSPQQAHWVVSIFRQRPSQFVQILLKETADEAPARTNPRLEAFATFAAFLVFGALPLLPYGIGWLAPWVGWSPFWVSGLASALALFGLGALRVRFTHRGLARSGLEMLATGGLAAGVAYAIGALLRGLGING
jgi:VIT1/CCC1 family predicted Fe2+/Mn2+ transporter